MNKLTGSTGTPVPRRASIQHAYPSQRQRADTEEDIEAYDDVWPPQMPKSAIRYTTTTDHTPVIVSGNRRYMLHHGLPPQQAIHAPPQEDKEQLRTHRRVHWTLIFGIGMGVMLLLWVLGSMVISWWNVTQDDWRYGRPRTFQIDQKVGHGDDQTPSHFIIINLYRRIEVIEFPGGDATHAKVYLAMTLIGDGEDLAVATVRFSDVNGDRKPDMIVSVGDTNSLFINENGQFRPLKPGEHINL